MGLLDNLQLGHGANFGGGLLDFLRTTQMQQQQYQPSQGFGNPMDANAQMQAAPMSIGNYQMPRMGAEQQFTPDPTTIPQNAQPTQGQMQPQPQAMGGDSYMDRINNGGSIIGSLFGSPQRNQTAQFLVSKGMDPAMAKTVVSDPALLRSVLPQIMGMGGQTDDIKEYQFAKREDPSLTFNKFMQQKKAVSGEYSLTPQYGTRVNPQTGKEETVLIQTGKSGEAIETKLPKDVKISSGVEKVDSGTHWTIFNKRDGSFIRTESKDIVGRESAEKVGQAQGSAKVALPAAEKTAERAIRMLSEIETHKGMSAGVGFVMGRLPALTPDAADFRERVEQLDAMVFGDAVEVMRGLGALTDREGPKITAARARLKTAKSEEDYKTALKDIREIFNSGIENMRQKAGVAAPAAPAPGGATVDDLLKKYGG